MESIQYVSEIFNNYGWPGMLAISGLLIIVFYIKYIIKKLDKDTSASIDTGFKKMSDVITEQNSKLLNSLIDQNNKNNEILSKLLYKSLEDHHTSEVEEHNRSIQHRLDISKIVQSKVRDLLYKYSADRSFIIEFHNSKQNITGLAFYWYDMMYEEISKGTSPISPIYKDQPVSDILPLVADVNEHGGYTIMNVNDLNALEEKSSVLYKKLRVDRDVNEAIIVGLYDSTNKLIGLLILEYEDSMIPVEVLDIEDILSQGASISTLLDFHR